MAEALNKVKDFMAANKKKIRFGLIVLVILAALGVGFHAMYEVDGVVTAKNGQNITVANFFRTQTVNLKGTAVDTANIKIGERVHISKNIQGQVISVHLESERLDGKHQRDGSKIFDGHKFERE